MFLFAFLRGADKDCWMRRPSLENIHPRAPVNSRWRRHPSWALNPWAEWRTSLIECEEIKFIVDSDVKATVLGIGEVKFVEASDSTRRGGEQKLHSSGLRRKWMQSQWHILINFCSLSTKSSRVYRILCLCNMIVHPEMREVQDANWKWKWCLSRLNLGPDATHQIISCAYLVQSIIAPTTARSAEQFFFKVLTGAMYKELSFLHFP